MGSVDSRPPIGGRGCRRWWPGRAFPTVCGASGGVGEAFHLDVGATAPRIRCASACTATHAALSPPGLSVVIMQEPCGVV